MVTIEVRVYDVDSEGRRFLLYRPGDVVTAAEAKRVAALVEPKPDKPGWQRLMERRDAPADEAPAPKGIDTNTNLSDLRAICASEGIDSGDANTRAEFRDKIEAGREKRRSTPNER